MKNFYFIASLFLCAAHISQAMKMIPQKNSEPSYATAMCLSGLNDQDPLRITRGLSKGADVNYVDKNGQSLFYKACQTKNSKFTKIIISQENIDPTLRDSFGNTPLYKACLYNFPTMVDSMLKKNPLTATISNVNGDTPLITASFFGHDDCMRTLLAHNNKNINEQNNDGKTALHAACIKRKFDCIKLLILNGATTTIKDNQRATPLMRLYFSINAHHWNSLENFLINNADIANKLILTTDELNNTQLHLCTARRSIDTAKFAQYLFFLSANGLNVHSRNKHGKRAVDLACEKYNAHHHQYIAKKTTPRRTTLTNQEKIMHCFLCFTSPYTECALFKAMLLQQGKKNNLLLPEIIQLIMYKYYALNIETIVAKKYKNYNKYYNSFIKNKIAIKQQLLENPEPALLWSV